MSSTLPDANDKQFQRFINAIQTNDLQHVKQCLNTYNPSILSRLQFNYRQPALYYAITSLPDNQSVQMCKLLIQYGANPKHKDQNEQTVLFYACRDGKVECCRNLLKSGLVINQVDMYGQTPLFYAASENRLTVVEFFQGKQLINHTDKLATQTALYYAARKGHTQMCRQLISRGANVLHLDSQNKTAADYAKKAKHNQTSEYLNQQLKRLKQPIIQQSQHSNDISYREQSYQINQKKIKKDTSTVPRATYKIVFMNEKGEAKDLTQQQVRSLVKNNPELQTYLANPNSIPVQQLQKLNSIQSWQKPATKVLQSVSKQKGAFWFLQPVDPVKFGIMDYFDIITHPMDLSTIKKKLSHNVYHNVEHFVDDMNLIWNNCCKYNGQNHEISKTARELEVYFLDEVKKTGLEKFMKKNQEKVNQDNNAEEIVNQ